MYRASDTRTLLKNTLLMYSPVTSDFLHLSIALDVSPVAISQAFVGADGFCQDSQSGQNNIIPL